MEPPLPVPPQPWSAIKKVFFRFGFLFVVLFIFFKPNQSYTIGLYNFYIRPFITPIQWIGKHILQISYPAQFYDGSDGGADDLFDYLSLFTVCLLSVIGTLIWSFVDRKRTQYRVLHYWFIAIIRYYLAFSMFQYGLAKVLMIQFAEATPGQLAEPYGMTSAMGLAWKFFGYSRGYNYFLGGGELLAAILLLFRRTAKLGAIVMLVVTINVMAVNYFYDVVVKEIATMLTIMSIILLLQDYRRYVAFFIYHRPTEADSLYKPRFRHLWINKLLVVAKYSIITTSLVLTLHEFIDALKIYGPNAPKPPVYGIFDAETFIKNNDTLAPLITDKTRWRKLIIGKTGTATIRMMNDSTKTYSFKADPVAKTISLTSRDSSRSGHFSYELMSVGTLMLNGTWNDHNKSDSLQITLKGVDLHNFRLVRSKMHFVNEFSTNY